MNNFGGTLITCPNCLQGGTTRYIGSVSAQGTFIVQQFHGQYTNIGIPSGGLNVSCNCGFGTVIKTGNIGSGSIQ